MLLLILQRLHYALCDTTISTMPTPWRPDLPSLSSPYSLFSSLCISTIRTSSKEAAVHIYVVVTRLPPWSNTHTQVSRSTWIQHHQTTRIPPDLIVAESPLHFVTCSRTAYRGGKEKTCAQVTSNGSTLFLLQTNLTDSLTALCIWMLASQE